MDQDDWKERYKVLSEELDQLQSQLNDRPLQHLILQMAVALDGQSERLDQSLTMLCDQLKADKAGKPDTINLVEKQLRGLDLEQQQHRKELLQGLQKWVYQLRLNLTTDLSNQRLSVIEEAMTPFSGQPAEVASLINDLVALQAPLLTDDFTGGRSQGILAELGHEDEELLQKIASELLSLMSGLRIPQGEMSLARELISRIERGISLSCLPGIIQDLVGLVSRLSAYNSEDFEDYLLNLTGQLAEVQAYVEASQKDGQLNEETALLSNGIHHDVQAIHQAMQDSNDLQQLKSNVSSQLQNIVKSVDLFKQKEENRERRLHERYLQLQERLEQMEEQTQQMKVHMEVERHKALTDSLTSLPNRAGYDKQIAAEFDRWKRYGQCFSIAVADLDLFKRINDSYGHQAGDKVLRLVASILTRQCRSTDFVSRYGGEEFVLLMPGTSAEQALTAVDKIRHAVESSPFNFHGEPVRITLSLGVAEVQADDTVEELFGRADKALYTAKRLGRNRIELG
ncbi:GGDEF domain-containing protein [Amphritea pacifica]|uniref:diguanylate cyclase n=1 Tax=Amphritea pacifica TaxID=2811233 RepID=A0ABS2W2C6_9GAMM|nr:GGDEF domain-containing protein [Amphritea pacifica]MBN0985751.1 GGDEF domain-containing protein [Amphritea pacifica]MBN1005832.1 GGDEF domain-containing protein [Amphritea pacifica]